jgi:hypothetical protein
MGMPAELGLMKPAAKAPAAPPAAAKTAKPVPAELGGIPAELGGGAKVPAELGGAGNGGAGNGGSGKSDWPIDNFPNGLYAPDGVPYPLVKAKELGELNPFTGLLDNPDGTTSFPDGTIVDAPNTWVMLSDNVVPVDEYKNEMTLAEQEQHDREIQNAKNESKYNQMRNARLNAFLSQKKLDREAEEAKDKFKHSFNQVTGLYTDPKSGKAVFEDGQEVGGVNTWVALSSDNMQVHKKHHHHHHRQ